MTIEKEHEIDNLGLLESAVLAHSINSGNELDKIKVSQNQTNALYEIKTKMNDYHDKFDNVNEHANKVSGIVTALALIGTIVAGSWLLNRIFHFNEALVFIDIVLIGMSATGSMLAFDLDDNAYGWIKNIFYSTKRYKKLKKSYGSYQKKISDLLQQEKFQHGYIAHLQLKLVAYEKALQDLKNNNNSHDYNIINALQADIVEFKTIQAHAIRNMLSENNEQAINNMCEIENSIRKMDAYLSHNQKFNLRQEKFIKSHQQFMDEQGINTMISQINEPEELKESRIDQQQLKTLL